MTGSGVAAEQYNKVTFYVFGIALIIYSLFFIIPGGSSLSAQPNKYSNVVSNLIFNANFLFYGFLLLFSGLFWVLKNRATLLLMKIVIAWTAVGGVLMVVFAPNKMAALIFSYIQFCIVLSLFFYCKNLDNKNAFK